MGMSAKDIAKMNLDREYIELKKLVLNLLNSSRTNNEKNIEAFSEFTSKLKKGEIPGDLEYDNLLFTNTLDIPFAGDLLNDVVEAGQILMALEAFPTVVPKAFDVALNLYKRTYHPAMTISNREMMFWVINIGARHLLTTHEHKEYDAREQQPIEPESMQDKYAKKKKFKKVK